MNGWCEYNRALVNIMPPHVPAPKQKPTPQYLKEQHLLLARWTDWWDYEVPTEWWYCIKDDLLDLPSLKAKRRYEITKGERNFIIKSLSLVDQASELFKVADAAFAVYPAQYRPTLTLQGFTNEMQAAEEAGAVGIAAYCKENGDLSGYAIVYPHEDWLDFAVQKTCPCYEKKAVNAALVLAVLHFFEEHTEFKYISDGARPIRHQTGFQSYLVKYFGFRYAYCRLNIVYHPWIDVGIKLTYPFRKLIYRMSARNPQLYNAYCLLEQERIRRTFL